MIMIIMIMMIIRYESYIRFGFTNPAKQAYHKLQEFVFTIRTIIIIIIMNYVYYK